MRPDLAVQSVPQNSVANDQNQYAQHSKSDSTFLSFHVAHYHYIILQCCMLLSIIIKRLTQGHSTESSK